MPSPRRFGETKMPRCEEYTTSLPTEISPCRGLSRPAMERSVVVLPQPLGPSRVNSLPSGTSKATSCTARIAWPRSSTYSVHNPVTLSTSGVLDAELPAYPLGKQHEHEQAQDEHHPERRQLDVLAVLPQLPDHDRQDLGPRAVEQDRARQLADGNDHDVDPARDQPWLEQRQDDAAEGRRPARSAHRGGFLQLLVYLQHRRGVVAQAVGHEAGEVGDEHDPDRAVNADRQVKVQDHDRQPEDDAGKYHRQGSDVVEQPPPGQFRLDDDPADHRGHQHDQRGAGHREEQAVPHRAPEVRIAEDGAVGIEGQPLQGLHRWHRIELLQRRPDENRERQHYDQQSIDQEDGGGDIAPAAEIDRSRAKALSGHGGVLAAAARQPGLEIHADRRDEQQGYRVGAGEADLAGVAVHRLVDGGGEDLDAHRQAKQGRDFEGLDRAHEQDQQRGKDRRPRERQRDARRHLQHAGAPHHRRFLQRRIHGAERRGHQQERHRRVVQAIDPHHSPQRVDVHEYRVGVEQPLENEIDQPDLRAAEQDPRHGEQDPWNDQRNHRQREEQPLEWRVGALVHPRQQGPDAERQRRRPEREAQRIPEQYPGVRRAVGLAVVAQREHGRLGGGLRREEALPQQEAERQHRQIQRQQHAGPDDQPFQIEAQRRQRRGRFNGRAGDGAHVGAGPSDPG